MNTVQILGALTAIEILVCGKEFNGATIFLWILYGIYKLIMS